MESILKADIFFFVTTIAIVLLTALLATALVYLIRSLRNIHESSIAVKNTVTHVSKKVIDTHDGIESFLQKLNVVQLFRSAFGFKRQNAKNKKHEDHGTKE